MVCVTLTFKTLHTNRRPYLTDLVQYYQPARCLRSSGSHQLVIPWHNLSLGSRGFSISATHIWNSLPSTSAKSSQFIILGVTFFQSAFPALLRPAHQCTLILLRFRFCVNLLLTYSLTCECNCAGRSSSNVRSGRRFLCLMLCLVMVMMGMGMKSILLLNL